MRAARLKIFNVEIPEVSDIFCKISLGLRLLARF